MVIIPLNVLVVRNPAWFYPIGCRIVVDGSRVIGIRRVRRGLGGLGGVFRAGSGGIAGPIGDGHGGQAHEADADAAFLPLQEKLEEASGECDSRYHQKKKGWI